MAKKGFRQILCLLLAMVLLFAASPVQAASYADQIAAMDQKIAAAEKELSSLQKTQALKKSVYEEKLAAYNKTMSASANSLIGWLEDKENGMGWTNATSYFNGITASAYSDTSGKAITAYTTIGADYDATDLNAVKFSLQFIEECNSIRSEEGLSELKVSARMMLEAAITANYIRNYAFEHPCVFYNSENISGGILFPFEIWYTQEKKDYLANNGNVTGHYLNIVDKDATLTGFGLSVGGFLGVYHVQDFGGNYSYITENTTTMSASTAIAKLNNYISAMSSKQASAKSAMESAKSAYTSAQTAVTNKQNEIASLKAQKTALIPTSVKIEEEFYAMKVGATKTLTATVKPNTAVKEFSYSSSDSSVVSVTSAGKLTAKKAGSATIKVRTANGKTGSITVKVTTDTPVYRLYLPGTGEHLYTTDANEVETLWKKYGWAYEGVGWYASGSGTPVYRLYNPGLANHLYTTDTNEVRVLTSKYGWKKDNNGKPLYYSSGSVSVYRVYNKGLSGMHHMTTDLNEYKTLPKYGWTQEGAKIKAVSKGDQITTNYFGK